MVRFYSVLTNVNGFSISSQNVYVDMMKPVFQNLKPETQKSDVA